MALGGPRIELSLYNPIELLLSNPIESHRIPQKRNTRNGTKRFHPLLKWKAKSNPFRIFLGTAGPSPKWTQTLKIANLEWKLIFHPLSGRIYVNWRDGAIWLFNSLPWKITIFKNGKPSISMGHLYHGYVSHNQRVNPTTNSPKTIRRKAAGDAGLL